MTILELKTSRRIELVDLTSRIQEVVTRDGLSEGAVVLQTLHTTAALTINENADPAVGHDIAAKLGQLVPQRETFYEHDEGNSDSHLKTSLFGPSLTVIVSGGRLVLGTWQGIYFCEWDGPRSRQVAVQLLGAAGATRASQGLDRRD